MADCLLESLDSFVLPRDPDDCRYVMSFPHSDSVAGLQFFQSWGFVVFRDVYSADECAASREAMWGVIEGANDGFRRDDPRTWDEFKAAGKYGLSSRGPTFDAVLSQNRQHPRLCRALAAVLEAPEADVMVSHDRFTIYRATHLDVALYGDGVRFRTGPRNIHLDMNPWWYLENSADILVGANSLRYDDPQDFIKENNLVVRGMGPHVQCVLNFADNTDRDGGTLIVPCFHKHLATWTQRFRGLRKPVPFVTFSGRDGEACEAELLQRGQRIPMRQGSVLMWSQTVMHGTEPNDSSTHRMAQFVKAFRRSCVLAATCEAVSAADNTGRMERRGLALQALLRETGALDTVTPLGASMFGLPVSHPVDPLPVNH